MRHPPEVTVHVFRPLEGVVTIDDNDTLLLVFTVVVRIWNPGRADTCVPVVDRTPSAFTANTL
jgi:hypothetical protein